MIDKETLIAYAKLNNLRPWQQEKHYMQSAILVALSEHPLVFKGGTYLWFFHGLPRFSEDLDFTLRGRLPEELGKATSEGLSLMGIENDLKPISNNSDSYSFRIAAKGPLNTSASDVCYVYVEISLREEVHEKALPLQLNLDAYKLPIKLVSGMALEEVAAEKVRAIMTRSKARDVFDLWFLLKKGVVPEISLMSKKLGFYDLEFDRKAFLVKLEKQKADYMHELKPLVFGDLPAFEEAASLIREKIR
ncbi:MAG: nucleotidyl transferase AbiEii/AbiGii toxin family protein [Candidatus Micrarchaeota archaeon]